MIKCFVWLCDQECSKLSIPFHISLPVGRKMLNGVIYHNCVGQSAGIILKSPGMFDLNLQVSSAQKLRVLYCVLTLLCTQNLTVLTTSSTEATLTNAQGWRVRITAFHVPSISFWKVLLFSDLKMTAPERAAFSEEKSAILTDPAYSLLSFKEHRNLGVTRLLSQSTGDESSLGATQQRSKLRNQLKIFFFSFRFYDRVVSRKKRQQLEKKRSKQMLL